jgi:tetratricopeptide (TPR) repeat protein
MPRPQVIVSLLLSLMAISSAQTPHKATQKPRYTPTPQIQRLIDSALKLPLPSRPHALSKAAAAALRKDDPIGYDSALSDYRDAQITLGKQADTEAYLRAQVSLAANARDRRLQATAIEILGEFLAEISKESQALPLYNQALQTRQRAADLYGQEESLQDLADAYASLQQNQKALEFCQQALQMERAFGDRKSEATTLTSIGQVYSEIGQKQKAMRLCRQALAIQREVGDRSGEETTLNNIGVLCQDLRQNPQALEFYQLALLIERELQDLSGEGTTLGNMATVYAGQGQKQKALHLLRQALPILRQVGDQMHEGRTLYKLGLVSEALGQKQKALEFYQRALPIEREVGDRSREAITWGCLSNCQAKDQPLLAIWYGKRAINLFQSLRMDMAGLDKDTKNIYTELVSPPYRTLADLLASQGRISEAEQVLRLLKEDEVYDYVRRSERSLVNERADYTPQEAEWDNEYETKTAGLADLARQVDDLKNTQERTKDQNAKLDALNDELAKREQDFQDFLKRVLAKAETLKLNTEKLQLATGVANNLDSKSVSVPLAKMNKDYPGVAAVYAFVAPDALRLFYFAPGHTQGLVSVIKEADLDKKILAFRQVLTDPRSDPRPRQRTLRSSRKAHRTRPGRNKSHSDHVVAGRSAPLHSRRRPLRRQAVPSREVRPVPLHSRRHGRPHRPV